MALAKATSELNTIRHVWFLSTLDIFGMPKTPWLSKSPL
jgi:hypothetical protein